jgi:uncharacterized membrane protein
MQTDIEDQNLNKTRSSNLDMTGDEPKRKSITILRTPLEVYHFWRDFKNLQYVMKDIAEIDVRSAGISHWVVRPKHSPTIEWDAEIISDRPGEIISWKSLETSNIKQAGSVWFSPVPYGLGTIVRLSLIYEIPGGKMSEWFAKLFQEDPETLILTNLRRLKAFLETGEIPTTEGQASGRDEASRPNPNHNTSNLQPDYTH